MKNSNTLNYFFVLFLTLALVLTGISLDSLRGSSVNAQTIGRVQSVQVSAHPRYSNGFLIKWSAVTGATGYQYAFQRRKGTGSWSNRSQYRTLSSALSRKRELGFVARSGYQYRFFFKATNGPAPITNQVTALFRLAQPSQPQVAFEAGPPESITDIDNNGAVVSWGALLRVGNVSGRTYEDRLRYDIQYKLNSDASWDNRNIRSALTNRYSFVNLVHGESYVFRVRAVIQRKRTTDTNWVDWSVSDPGPWSDVSAVYTHRDLTNVPGKVRGVSIESSIVTDGDGNTTLTLSWSRENNAESYQVGYRIISGIGRAPWRDNDLDPTTSTRQSVIQPEGTVFIFRVRGQNRAGSGPWSDVISSTSDVVFDVPQGLVVVMTNNSESAIASWRSVRGTNIVYEVLYREKDVGADWIHVEDLTQPVYQNARVPYGKTFEFTVRAKKSGTNYGIWSDIVTVTNTNTPQPAPSPVTNLSVTERMSNSFTVNWNRSATADRYLVEYYRGSTRISSSTITGTRFQATNSVEPNTSYRVRVTAIRDSDNARSTATEVTVSTYTDPVSPPSPVTNLQVIDRMSNSFTVNWNRSATADRYLVEYYRGSTRISSSTITGTRFQATNSVEPNTSYRVRVTAIRDSDNARSTATEVTVSVYNQVSQLSQVTGLAEKVEPNTSYRVRVTAIRDSDNARSTATEVTVSVYNQVSQLSQVTGLAEKEKNQTSITVRWNPIPNADSYDVGHCSSDCGAGGSGWNFEDAATRTNEFMISDLRPSTEYGISVRARNNQGATGRWSASINVTTESAQAPSPPAVTNLRDIAKTDTSVTLRWDVQTQNNDASYKYEVWYCLSTRCSTIDDWRHVTTTNTERAVDNLFAGTTYYFAVRSLSGQQQGEFSDTHSVTTRVSGADNVPTQVQALRYRSLSPTALSIIWNVVPNAKSYDIEYRRAGVANWEQDMSSDISIQLDDLSANTSYEVRVRGRNEIGIGNWSNVLSAITPVDSLSKVTGLKAIVVSDTEINLQWNASSATPAFRIAYKAQGTQVWNQTQYATSASKIIGSLMPNTIYEFSVGPVSAVGQEVPHGNLYSDVITATTQAASTQPARVTGLRSTTIADTSVALIWNPVVGDVQYEVRSVSAVSGVSTTMSVQYGFTTVCNLTPSTLYTFTARAVDNDNRKGPWSESVSATTAPLGQSPEVSITATACPTTTGPTGPTGPTGSTGQDRDINGRVLVDGDIAQVSGSIDVYILKMIRGKKFKRLILNPQIFESYGHLRWDNIRAVSQATLNNYATSNLVQEVFADGRPVNSNIYALYPEGDVGVKRLVVGGSYDVDSVYKINHLEAGETFYRTGPSVTLGSGTGTSTGAGVGTGSGAGIGTGTGIGTGAGTTSLSAPRVSVVSTAPTIVNIQYNDVPGATQYLVEWRVRNSNSNFWSFQTNRTIASIWGNIIANTEYEIYVTPLNAAGAKGSRSTPVYARTS